MHPQTPAAARWWLWLLVWWAACAVRLVNRAKLSGPSPRVELSPPSQGGHVSAQSIGFDAKVSFLCAVVDELRGNFKSHEYGQVLLPFLVMRRLEFLETSFGSGNCLMERRVAGTRAPGSVSPSPCYELQAEHAGVERRPASTVPRGMALRVMATELSAFQILGCPRRPRSRASRT